jgi:hypothetical protein
VKYYCELEHAGSPVTLYVDRQRTPRNVIVVMVDPDMDTTVGRPPGNLINGRREPGVLTFPEGRYMTVGLRGDVEQLSGPAPGEQPPGAGAGGG